MVRRLVEQEQIRLPREQSREMRAHHPTAAHFARGAIEIFFAKAETGEDLFGLGLDLIAVQFIKTVVHIVVNFLRMQRLHGMIGIPRFDDAPELRELRRDGGGDLNDRFIADRRAFLRQMIEGNAALKNDLAIVRGFLAEKERKERGLPCPIRADEANAVFAINLQRDVFKENTTAVGFADAGKSEHEIT